MHHTVMDTFDAKQESRSDLPQHRRGMRPPARETQRVTPTASARPGKGRRFVSRDGRPLRLRPIHPDDSARLIRAFGRMTPEQVRLRVFHVLTELPEAAARHLCKPDPDNVAAFVVTDDDGEEIRGEARVHFDAATEAAEFAIAIDPQYTGKGVGWALMNKLIDCARAHGMREIWGHVLTENGSMLDLAQRLGFDRASIAGEPGVLRVHRLV